MMCLNIRHKPGRNGGTAMGQLQVSLRPRESSIGQGDSPLSDLGGGQKGWVRGGILG